jgi:hypothetical protein
VSPCVVLQALSDCWDIDASWAAFFGVHLVMVIFVPSKSCDPEGLMLLTVCCCHAAPLMQLFWPDDKKWYLVEIQAVNVKGRKAKYVCFSRWLLSTTPLTFQCLHNSA